MKFKVTILVKVNSSKGECPGQAKDKFTDQHQFHIVDMKVNVKLKISVIFKFKIKVLGKFIYISK